MISKWGESNLKIKAQGDPLSSRVEEGKEIIIYPGFEARVYEVELGIEFDIVLDSEPLSNVFSFDLEYEGLEFFYQPPLTEEIKEKGWIVNETHAFDLNGTLRVYRPVDVVGSYAVYGLKSSNEYGSGKFGHIYRPKIYDVKGAEVYGELLIEEGRLSITVPQTFLNKAVYPVIVDPTFGYTSIGASQDNNPWGNNKVGWRFKNRVGDGNITHISVYGRAVTTNGSMRAGIYLANEIYPNIPTVLKGSSGEILVNTSLQWYVFPISAVVWNNTEYYLTIHRKPGFANFRNYYDAGVYNQAIQDADTYADGLSDPFDALGEFDWNFTRKGSIFANVTASTPSETEVLDPSWMIPGVMIGLIIAIGLIFSGGKR
jgi:hypothetical protein